MQINWFKSFNIFRRISSNFLTRKEKEQVYIIYKNMGFTKAKITYICIMLDKLNKKLGYDLPEHFDILNIEKIEINPIFKGYSLELIFSDLKNPYKKEYKGR